VRFPLDIRWQVCFDVCMSKPATPNTVIFVRLRDGTEHAWRIADLPKHVRPRNWKSWVKEQLPYDTSFFMCKWGMR
jgi:hypothetical protein